MKCDYKDDFKVDYSGKGSLHITKGDGIDFSVKASDIPSNVKSCLDSAVHRNSCHELRAAAKAFTGSISKAFDKE
jgi:hypothetical protein